MAIQDQKPNPEAFPKRFRFNLLYLVLALWLTLSLKNYMGAPNEAETVSYSQFLSYLSDNTVTDVTIGSERIDGNRKVDPSGKTKAFSTLKVDDPDLIHKLENAHVTFSRRVESTLVRDAIAWLLPVFLMVGFWWFLLSRMGKSAGQGVLSFGKSKAKIYAEKDLPTRFSDVAGVDESKAELQEVVEYLKDPHRFGKLGGRMPKGVLLVGPPGTGKTLLARAVAGEAGVPFFSINGSEFVEMFVGLGAARVRDLFQQARASAPCIIFIDELDALGKSRGFNAISGGSNDEKEQTLNQLLAELDGFDATQGIVLLAATNRPEVLDPALLRSGRFDRQILVDKPDRQGRAQILAVHTKKIKVSPNVSMDTLASLTAGFSGADLANLANEAALVATRRGAETVELSDFTAAIERLIAGLERKNRVLNYDEKRRVAYHEMGHAVVGLALGKTETIHKISVIPRGIGALGYTFRRPTEDRYLMSQSELEAKIAVLLGGRASEQVFFEEISTGASDDLSKASDIARAMVTRFGMSPKLGTVTYETEPNPLLGGQIPTKTFDFSQETTQEIDHEVKRIMDDASRRAEECLHTERALVEEGARILLEKETLEEHEIKLLWEKYHSPTSKPAPLRISNEHESPPPRL